MIRRAALALALMAVLPASPAIAQDQPPPTFDASEVGFIHSEGANSVVGQGFTRTRGGEVRVCAGEPVFLTPVSPLATYFFQEVYGSSESGSLPANSYIVRALTVTLSSDRAWLEHRRTTTCNAQGEFTFTGLADGDYYVDTKVIWMTPLGEQTGSAMFERVSLRGGQAVEIVLSP